MNFTTSEVTEDEYKQMYKEHQESKKELAKWKAQMHLFNFDATLEEVSDFYPNMQIEQHVQIALHIHSLTCTTKLKDVLLGK